METMMMSMMAISESLGSPWASLILIGGLVALGLWNFIIQAGIAAGSAIAASGALDEEDEQQDEIDHAKKRAQLDALNYEPYQHNEDAYRMEAGSVWGSGNKEQIMGTQLADVGQFNEARRQQMTGRGQQQQGLGLLGESARGGGGNEMLRAFAAGEGDVAGRMQDRAMGKDLVAEKLALAQRGQLQSAIATQAASGRGGYDPASRRAAITAMSQMGQQQAAGTAALGAQEADMAARQYQSNRLAGAGAYQKGMLGAQSAYAGALQGMRGQDIGVMGLEQRDVARQQAGTLGKMGVGMGYEQMGLEDKFRRKGAEQLLDKRQADEKARAMGIRMGQYQQEMKDEQTDDEQTRKTWTGIAKAGSDMIESVGKVGGAATGKPPTSDERAKKNVDQADINVFLKSLGEAKGEATGSVTTDVGDRLAKKGPELKRFAGRVDSKLRGAGHSLKHDAGSMGGPGPAAGVNVQRKEFVDRGDPDTPIMDDAIKAISMGQPMTPEMKLAMFPPVPDQGQPQPGPQTQPLPPAGAPPMMNVNAQDPASYAQPQPGPGDSPWEQQLMASDEDVKTARADAPMGEFLGPLEAETWEYRDKERHGYGRHTGPMAQHLQKSAVGSELVSPDERGVLRVDYDPKRVGPIMLSALGHLNDRIEKLEG